ncbi:MAG: cell division protein ZapB [Desulfatibacillum sp.]|nr:cell division protein ZapB [Desulfatibacillum sp.]
MDEESIFQEFDRLESKLNGLILQCETLRAQNTQLEAQTGALEEELRQKTANELKLTEERSMVRSRIDGLLARVNETIGTEQEDYNIE